MAVLLAWSALAGWFLRRLRSLLQESRNDTPMLLLQQQIDQFRGQFGQSLDRHAQFMQQQLGQILGHVNERLRENAQTLQQVQQGLGERLDNAARVVGQVQKTLGGLEEANQKIFAVGKDIASLQEILRAPKARGGLGEFFLEDLLAQILPAEHFVIQHSFKTGEKVDAAIRLGPLLVPVDSKFPLENFLRTRESTTEEERVRAKKQFAADVRKHIDAIAAKYILPDEGTYDFALMYIPAENVYYEIIIKDEALGEKNLHQYALSKRVIPVSPSSFYAYLQAIVLGLRGLRIEERAKDMIQYLSRLQGDFLRFRDDFALLGKHLGHAQASYQSTEKKLDQFGQKLLSAEADPQELLETSSSKSGAG